MTQISIEQVRDVLRLVDYFENIPLDEWASAEQKTALDYAKSTGLIDGNGKLTDSGLRLCTPVQREST